MNDKLNEINTNKVIRIRDILDIIVKDGFSIFNKFIGKSDSIEIVTYSNIFLRFIYCFEATKTLLVGFEKTKTYHEYSIALLLRASLLDVLTILYLKTFYLDSNNDANSELNYRTELLKLLSSQIRRSFNVEKNTEDFKPEIFRNFVDHIKGSMGYLFINDIPIDYDSPSKSLIYNNNNFEISPRVIQKRLKEASTPNDFRTYKNVFYLYDHYSKYDHFGVMGTLLMRMDINEIFQNILNSLYYLVDGISFCMEFMKLEKDFDNEYNNMILYLGELRGKAINKVFYLSDEYKEQHYKKMTQNNL